MSWDKIPPTKEELSWMSKSPSEEAPEVSQTEAAIRGAAQGATMGFADEATGIAEVGLGAIKGDVPLSREDLLKAYRESRDKTRQLYSQAEEAHPGTYLAGEVAGGVGSAVALPALGAAKLATPAIAGGITGLGKTEELDSRALDDIEIGMVTGTIGAGIGSLVGKGISKGLELGKSGLSKLQNFLNKQGNIAATRTLGLSKASAEGLGQEGQERLGEQMFKHLPIKSRQTQKELFEEASRIKDTTGAELGELYKKAAQIIPEEELPKLTTQQIKDIVEKNILTEEAQTAAEKGLPALNKVERVVKPFAPVPTEAADTTPFGVSKDFLQKVMPEEAAALSQEVVETPSWSINKLRALQQELSNLGYSTKTGLQSTTKQPFREAERSIKDLMMERIGQSGDEGAEIAGKIRELDPIYSVAKTASSELDAAIAAKNNRSLLNRIVSAPKELLLPKATTEAVGLKAMSRGAGAMSRGAGKLSEVLPKDKGLDTLGSAIGRTVENKNTYSNLADMDNDQVAELSERLRQQGAEEYSRVLDKALAGDKQSRDAMLFSLSQQPSFRKIVNPQE